MGYGITFDGVSSLAKGCVIETRPDIPAPSWRKATTQIPGRDGQLCTFDGAVDDITVKIRMGFRADTPEAWAERSRELAEWILGSRWEYPWYDILGGYTVDSGSGTIKGSSGYRNLVLSDDPLYYYRVKDAKVGNFSRKTRRIGTFTAEFTCDGFRYLAEGAEEHTIAQVRSNPYSTVCKPLYRITGEGLLSIYCNGKTFKVNVGQNAVIDTENMITYRRDGTIRNADVTGNYEYLWLFPGSNSLSVSSSSFTVAVVPNWRRL